MNGTNSIANVMLTPKVTAEYHPSSCKTAGVGSMPAVTAQKT
jgi:hypothetical protein